MNVQLSGFQPTTTYTVQFFNFGSVVPDLDRSVTTDGNGAALLAQPFSLIANGFVIQAQVDGVSSETVEVACQAP